MKKIIYLTYNDAPSGIYAGQVIDVCRYWKETFNYEVLLVAFISIRSFSENKKKITAAFPDAVVLPMAPKARNWKLNRFLLGRIVRKNNPGIIVGRGPFATALAFRFRTGRKICFDGRGAYMAELNEYNVVPDEKVKQEIASLEKKVVLESDFRLAVSEALVSYWKNNFGYAGEKHIVVPCTLNSRSHHAFPPEETIRAARQKRGFSEDDIVIVYSGSGAGWQSLQQLGEKLEPLFRANEKLKLLLLLRTIPAGFSLAAAFPDRVQCDWLPAEEVIAVMAACDYGWLVRENSVTNHVASPVKFAEYLSAGLRVIISPELGDYPAFVAEHNAGICLGEKMPTLSSAGYTEKARLHALAAAFFTKEKYRDDYLRLLA